MNQLYRAARAALLVVLMASACGILSAQPNCYSFQLRSTYGFYYTSGVPGSQPYGIGVGVVSFDGAGKGTSTETVSINGTIMTATASVTYTINPDCTGTITWTYPDYGGLVVKGKMVVTDNWKTIYTIGTDAGSMSYGVYTKQ